jgi:hypothetical protein
MSSYPHHLGWKAPGASRNAAAHAVARHAKTLRVRVLAFLRVQYPTAFSADQIADGSGETILSVRPRVSEVHKSREIEAAEGRHKNASGLSAHYWRARSDR